MRSRHTLILLLSLLFSCGKKDNIKFNPGKILTLSLTPGYNNPRNSEGDFMTLKDGRLLFVYSHFTGESASDDGPAYLAARFSSDSGRTWTKTDIPVARNNEGGINVMSVSLIRLNNQKIALFYVRKNSATDSKPMLRLSSDEGQTWSEPISCINDQRGYFTINNNRVIQLKSGRILLPVAYFKDPLTVTWHNIGVLTTYYSDDNGLTWKSGSSVPNPEKAITQEPGVIELKDRIMMYSRTTSNTQYTSISKDRGQTWTPARASKIKSPLSSASIVRIPATGDLLMLWNNNGGDNPSILGKRTPFNLAISKDEGETWEHYKTLENNPDGWYCYTAVHFIGNYILLAHTAGNSATGKVLSTTNITRLTLDWVYGPEN